MDREQPSSIEKKKESRLELAPPVELPSSGNGVLRRIEKADEMAQAKQLQYAEPFETEYRLETGGTVEDDCSQKERKGEKRLAYAPPFKDETVEIEAESQVQPGVRRDFNTPGAINIIPGSQPERRFPAILSSEIINIVENEFDNEQGSIISLENDNPTSTSNFMTIANANLVKPKEEEARIIDNFVNTMAHASLVEKNGSAWKKNIFITLIVLIPLALIFFFLFSTEEPTNNDLEDPEETKQEKLVKIFNSITDENQLLEDGSPQNMALSWLVGDDTFQKITTTDADCLERYIAVVLYFSTEGKYWNDDLNFVQNTSVCEWRKEDVGVECNLDGEIISIIAANNNLNGTLPSELLQLPSLAILKLSNNTLTGTIPDIYMESKSMRELYLEKNALNGSIPEFQRGVGYHNIHLGRNELTGNIPESVSALSSLKVLNFGDNSLNGTIPTGISVMESLERINFSSNNLSGSIPHQMENLRDIRRFEMQKNKLTGTISSNLARLDKLNYIALHHNKLTGSIPSELAALENIWTLVLDNNKLTGTFPKEFSSSINLLRVDIHDNSIRDSLDESFCSEDAEDIFIAADCRGLDPKVQCSCCNTCCNDSGCWQTWTDICKYEMYAELLMQSQLKEGVTCDCIEGSIFHIDRFLKCTFSTENPCVVCNTEETTCIRAESVTYKIDGNNNLYFSTDMRYIKGRDSSISIGISTTEYCSTNIDGKECDSCELQNCGSNSQRVPRISCLNNDEVNNLFDGCNDNIGTSDAGVFEVFVLLMRKELVSEASCNIPFLFDLTSVFDEYLSG